MSIRIHGLAIGGVLAIAAAANAQAPFSVYENGSNVDLTGFSISATALTAPAGTARFEFNNASSGINAGARIDDIYFENSPFAQANLSGGSVFAQSAGVSFDIPANPGNPGGQPNPAYLGTFASFGRTGGGGNAINVGESLTIQFNLLTNITVADLQTAISDGSLRIFAHTQALTQGASVFAFTVPTPGAAGLASLGLLAASRRRRA